MKVALVLVVLALAAFAAAETLMGTETDCINFFCTETSLSLVSFDPKSPEKITKLVTLLSAKSHVFIDMKQISGFDPATKVSSCFLSALCSLLFLSLVVEETKIIFSPVNLGRRTICSLPPRASKPRMLLSTCLM
jgi:hypothetical protein